MQFILALVILTLISFAFHFAWEKIHIGFYTGYEKLGKGMRLTFMATCGDVMYTLLAILFVSLVKKDVTWMWQPSTLDYACLALLGFCIALFVEYKALAFKRWAYKSSMPLVWGIGVSPLAQMTILLPFSVFSTAVARGMLHIVPLGV